MIWPFNFAKRKALKIGHAQIMLTGYKQRLSRLQTALDSGGKHSLVLLDEEQEAMRKVAEWEQQIRELVGEVKP